MITKHREAFFRTTNKKHHKNNDIDTLKLKINNKKNPKKEVIVKEKLKKKKSIKKERIILEKHSSDGQVLYPNH